MMEEKYKEIIEKIKEKFSEEINLTLNSQHIKFDIENGVLWSIGLISLSKSVMNAMQEFVNQELGQKEYIGEFIIKKKIYARNEEEAKFYFQETGAGSKLYNNVHRIYENK